MVIGKSFPWPQGLLALSGPRGRLTSGPISYPLLPRGWHAPSPSNKAALIPAVLAQCSQRLSTLVEPFRSLQSSKAYAFWPILDNLPLKNFFFLGLIDTRIHLGLLAILPKQLILSWLISHGHESLLFCQIVQSCLFPTSATCSDNSPYVTFSCLHPTMTSPERTLPASSDYQKGLPEALGDNLPPSICLLLPQTTWHQPRFLSDLQGPRKSSYCCCPALAMPRTHLSSDFNAGSSPDALRCRGLGSRDSMSEDTGPGDIFLQSERKDSLSKPHPFTATQFPFFVSWLKPMSFFLLLSSMVSGSLLLSAIPPPPPAQRSPPSFAWDLWQY